MSDLLTNKLTVYLSDEDLKLLTDFCDKLGEMPKSALVRIAIRRFFSSEVISVAETEKTR